MTRALWVGLGFVCLAVGTVGIVLPFLPTVPLYMATVFCFAKGSQRLHDWFVSTDLYLNHLDSFVQQRAMTMATKVRIVATVTIVMGIGFAMMGRVPAARVVLVIVWLFHLYYFFFRIRTIED